MEDASSPHDFKLMLASAGQRASDISQLGDEAGAPSARRGAGRRPRCRAGPQSPLHFLKYWLFS